MVVGSLGSYHPSILDSHVQANFINQQFFKDKCIFHWVTILPYEHIK